MENLLKGIPCVVVYLNDILVTGENVEEHLEQLHEVLSRIQKAEMRLKRARCSFMMTEVTYLGHVISQTGIRPAAEKVRAIHDAPVPTNVSQSNPFFGLINFYSHFLPNLSTLLAPLHTLLQKNMPWKWGPPQQEAFSSAKNSHPHRLLLTTAVTNH